MRRREMSRRRFSLADGTTAQEEGFSYRLLGPIRER